MTTTDQKAYGRAYRAALANIPREGKYADERYAKDAARACANIALSGVPPKDPNEPAMKAALDAIA